MKLLIVKLFFLYFNKHYVLSFDLHKIVQAENFYQITTFISDDFKNVSNLNIPVFGETPNKIYSFKAINQQLYDKSSESERKNVYSLQGSLVILHTGHLNKTNLFIHFLVQQLSVGKRPKCLIVYSSDYEERNVEIDTIQIFKYSWGENFLDFTIIIEHATKTSNLSSAIYYFNPFFGIVHRRKLNKCTEIFPEKLRNANEYPFYYDNAEKYDYFDFLNFDEYRRLNGKVEIVPRYEYVVNFVASIINLNAINISHDCDYTTNYLSICNLDMKSYPMFYESGWDRFIIPLDETQDDLFAIVPVLPIFGINFFSIALYIFIITFGIIFIFYYLFKRFGAFFG